MNGKISGINTLSIINPLRKSNFKN